MSQGLVTLRSNLELVRVAGTESDRRASRILICKTYAFNSLHLPNRKLLKFIECRVSKTLDPTIRSYPLVTIQEQYVSAHVEVCKVLPSSRLWRRDEVAQLPRFSPEDKTFIVSLIRRDMVHAHTHTHSGHTHTHSHHSYVMHARWCTHAQNTRAHTYTLLFRKGRQGSHTVQKRFL